MPRRLPSFLSSVRLPSTPLSLFACAYTVASGVYLRDLTFIEDGNQDHTPAGLVNVEKLILFGAVVSNMRRHQQNKFIPVTERFLPTLLLTIEHQWLIAVPENADDEMYALSTSHEPFEG